MYWIVNITVFLIVLAVVAVIYVPRLREQCGLSAVMEARSGISPDLLFVMLTMLVALFWFGPLSYVRIFVWCAVVLAVVRRGNHRWTPAMTAYLPFLVWLIAGVFYSDAPVQGVKIVCRYAAPLLFVWLGYRAVDSLAQIEWLFRRVWWMPLLLSFFVGGFAWAISIPWFDYVNSSCFGLVKGYGFLADYVAVTVFVPLALFVLSRNLWWLLVVVLYFAQTVLNVVRTGIGALFVGVLLFAVVFLRRRAIPVVLGLIVVAGLVFTQIPDVRQKMFARHEGPVYELLDAETPFFEQINPTFRDRAWGYNLERFYEKSPVVGVGTGTVVHDIKANHRLVMHNDYVVTLCENGIIGIVLYGAFAIFFLVHTAVGVWTRRRDTAVAVTGATAVGSMGAAFFCMGFDNAVSYLMQCYIFPFIFYGFFLKFADIYDSTKNIKKTLPL